MDASLGHHCSIVGCLVCDWLMTTPCAHSVKCPACLLYMSVCHTLLLAAPHFSRASGYPAAAADPPPGQQAAAQALGARVAVQRADAPLQPLRQLAAHLTQGGCRGGRWWLVWGRGTGRVAAGRPCASIEHQALAQTAASTAKPRQAAVSSHGQRGALARRRFCGAPSRRPRRRSSRSSS